ncbi:MAG: hypothetical protein LLG14_20405 [Nocardiaceae bacterium]|nr:hypothetical protein [Nocardiaceae bacterium]
MLVFCNALVVIWAIACMYVLVTVVAFLLRERRRERAARRRYNAERRAFAAMYHPAGYSKTATLRSVR